MRRLLQRIAFFLLLTLSVASRGLAQQDGNAPFAHPMIGQHSLQTDYGEVSIIRHKQIPYSPNKLNPIGKRARRRYASGSLGKLNDPHLKQKAPFKHIRLVSPAVKYDPIKGGWQYDTLLFLEEGTERVVSTVPVKSLDPFVPIMSGTVSNEELRPPEYYEISENTRKALREYLQNAGWVDKISADSVHLIRWEPLVYDISSITDYIAIGFQLYLMDEHNVIFAQIAEYKVLDKRGNVTAELRSDLGGAPPIVTQDGKWMAVRYGEEYADYSLPTGLVFFDLETKQAVYQDTITPNIGWWVGYFPIHDYIVNVNDYGSSFKNMYSIFKLNEGKKYTRLFDATAGSPGAVVFEHYDTNGVYYPASRYDGPDAISKKRANFEDDFELTNLKKSN